MRIYANCLSFVYLYSKFEVLTNFIVFLPAYKAWNRNSWLHKEVFSLCFLSHKKKQAYNICILMSSYLSTCLSLHNSFETGLTVFQKALYERLCTVQFSAVGPQLLK
jgi:hypothetical protein